VLCGLDDVPATQEIGSWVAIEATRAGLESPPLYVCAALAVPRAPHTVHVLVSRLGDREADLARLLQVQDLLDRHPGGDTAQLYLLHGGRRRRLDTGAALMVAWSAALREELEALLGPDTIELLPDGGHAQG
jgi:hypothetical protein